MDVITNNNVHDMIIEHTVFYKLLTYTDKSGMIVQLPAGAHVS